MGAITEEISAIVAEMGQSRDVSTKGMRDYHVGSMWGVPVVAVFSRIGKVAAASTATQLIADYQVEKIIFTGVAGGIEPSLNVGDIVVAGDLYQHDMDARPLFGRHEIPLLGRTSFTSTHSLRQDCLEASRNFLADDLPHLISPGALAEFGIDHPKAVEAAIASGDKFFTSEQDSAELLRRLPAACVEMEGAAVAQVCHEYQTDYAVIRTISDSANHHAPVDFQSFIQQIAAIYSYGVIKRLLCKVRDE